MRLEPLYTVRFRYPHGWDVGLSDLHKQADVELVFEVSELVWEAPAD